jgi:predicted lipoprotein
LGVCLVGTFNKNMNTSFLKFLYIFSALLIIQSCKKSGCTDPNALNYDIDAQKDDNGCLYEDFDKLSLLTNLADNYIIPSLDAYKSKIVSLNIHVDSFILNPNISNLSLLRTNWEEALLNWQDIGFLDFGPSEYILLRKQTNTFPIDTTELNNFITLADWNLDYASSYDSKGLQALDYLLFKPGYTDSELITYFQNNTNAKNYLKAVAEDLNQNINYVTNQWVSYREDFINDFEVTQSNFSTNSQGSSISNIINALCLHYEFYVRRGKVGLPLGVFNGFSQLELPELVECYYSGKSTQNLVRSINSLRKYVTGSSYLNNDNGLGLDDYMDFVNAEQSTQQLSTVIDNQFLTITEEVNNINGPLSEEIINNKSQITQTYQKLQQLVPYIKVDMTSALGVLITYQDNDGD